MEKRFLQMKTMAKAVIVALLIGTAGKMYAYDFSAVCETGQTLYYNIIDTENHYVELTYPGEYSNPFNPWPNSDEKPIGNIILPSIVNYNDNDYSVTTIGQYAFYNCNGLTGSLIIPNSVISINSCAFLGCSGFNGNLVIPNSVTTIGGGFSHGAFQGCNGFIGDLIIPNSVETIEDYAFFQCSGFSGSLIIPNSVTTIGEGAFRECSGFDGSLTLPNTLVTINRTTFQDCSGFTGSLSIPNTVTSIGGYAFYNCSGFNGTLDLGNSLTSIGEVAFRNCSHFTGSLVIPNTVVSIGYRAFYSCFGFNELKILASLTTISDYTFYDCYGFSGSLIIPTSVTTIGQYAFYDCYSLSEIVMLGINPPSLGNSAFSLSGYPPISACPIYVPYESLNVYKSATNWNNYEYKSRIYPMAYASVSGYGESNGNWQFIASPLAESIAPTEIDDMLPAAGTYDLYSFDQTENAEWQNYKANNFTFTNGQGYLYANAEDVNLFFKGVFTKEETKEVDLAYDANATFAGWNLVGNPFPVSAYANKSYYVMNEEGSDIEPVAVSSSTAIAPCTGVMVKAEGIGESVTFSKTLSDMASNQGNLQITMRENTLNMDGISTGSMTVDKVIVSFNVGDALEKFVFNFDNAQLSIKQDGKDYAIVCAEKQGEMPLNFKAAKNGNYTLVVNTENMEMDYLHLIDNLTGRDIDLLAIPDYTFEAKTSDYASRFKLVYMPKDDVLEGAESFSYYADGRLVIPNLEGVQIMQVVDMLGRIVMSESVTGCYDKQLNLAPGVYVVRLNERTQKIVVE